MRCIVRKARKFCRHMRGGFIIFRFLPTFVRKEKIPSIINSVYDLLIMCTEMYLSVGKENPADKWDTFQNVLVRKEKTLLYNCSLWDWEHMEERAPDMDMHVYSHPPTPTDRHAHTQTCTHSYLSTINLANNSGFVLLWNKLLAFCHYCCYYYLKCLKKRCFFTVFPEWTCQRNSLSVSITTLV